MLDEATVENGGVSLPPEFTPTGSDELHYVVQPYQWELLRKTSQDLTIEILPPKSQKRSVLISTAMIPVGAVIATLAVILFMYEIIALLVLEVMTAVSVFIFIISLISLCFNLYLWLHRRAQHRRFLEIVKYTLLFKHSSNTSMIWPPLFDSAYKKHVEMLLKKLNLRRDQGYTNGTYRVTDLIVKNQIE